MSYFVNNFSKFETINKINMKSWKTTVTGLIVFLPVAMDAILEAYNSGAFTSKSGLQLFVAVGAIVLARLAKDYDVTGVKKENSLISDTAKNIVADIDTEDIAGGGQKNT
jgi:hypothetical protein